MSSTFHARSATAYDHFMGRWSRRLARPFIDFAGICAGERVIDVGCGTGSLAFALSEAASQCTVVGIDLSDVYLEEARLRNHNSRIVFQRGDATALEFADSTFDRAVSMLVLQFVPDADLAVREMRRVVRAGGVVAAAVWDSFGGVPAHRMFWDAAANLGVATDKDLSDYFFRPMTRPTELKAACIRQGLTNVEQSSLTIRMDFDDFDDYWAPIAAGEATLGKFASNLMPPERERLKKGVRTSYLAGQLDGPRSFGAIAWVCKGIVP